MDKLVIWTYNSVLAYGALVTLKLTFYNLSKYRIIIPFICWVGLDNKLVYEIDYFNSKYKIKINESIIDTIVNTLHAGFTSLSALLFIFQYINLNVYEEVLVISSAYLLYDLVKLIFLKEKNKINLQFMFHHSIVLINLIPLYKKELIILDNYHYLTAVLYLSEFTTIPLNISWTLYELDKKDSILFKCSILSTILLYIPFRLFTSVYTFYILYQKSYYNSYMFFTILFIILNYYWFYKLISKFMHNN